MAKLIYDIIPPQVNQKRGRVSQEKPSRKRRSLSWWGRVLGLILAVVIGGVVYQIGFSSFHLLVWPKTQIVSAEKELMIAVRPSTEGGEVIQGMLVNDKKTLQKVFSTTGRTNEGAKATGTIRVYNNYRPPRSLTLRAQTRFLSSTGKYFRSAEKIYLPPAKWVGGKLIPSWVDIKVVALAEGPDYNIKPDKFSIPGLVGTVYYSKVYGQSFNSMTGGSISSLPQVSQEDFKQAREVLKKQLFSLSKKSLEGKIGKDFIFLPSSFSQDFQDKGSSVKIGDKVPQFDYEATATSQAIVFSSLKARSLMRDLIQKKIGYQKGIVPDSLMVTYRPLAVNFDQQVIDCNIQATAKVYSLVKKESLQQLVAGKGLEEVSALIREHFPQFSEVKGVMKPFWERRIPSDLSRIQVKFYLNH